MTPPRRPTRWYAGEPRATRLHVALRWATCPFGAVHDLVPAGGRVLDWGCGHGLGAVWLAEQAPERIVHGVDLDPDKVAVAARVAARTPFARRLSFVTAEFGALPEGRWDAIVVVDVLYLLDEERQRAALAAAAAALAPGGVLVVKDMADRPRWKALATRAQEQVVVRALGLTATEGEVHSPPGPDAIGRLLAGAGLGVAVVPMHAGYHCPHVAVVGRRPTGSSPEPGSRSSGVP